MDQRKCIVRAAYDAIAPEWGDRRRFAGTSKREQIWIDRFLAAAPSGGRIVDLGCGVGVPILANLVARKYQAVGVDFSWSSLREARSHCPGTPLVRADLADVAFAPSSFDAAIAFDSIWHVPHQEHPYVFANLREWLVDGAVALITLAAAPDGKGDLFTHLLGAPIYYDARPVEKSLQVLRAAGFSVLDHHMEPVSATRPLSGHLMVLVEAA